MLETEFALDAPEEAAGTAVEPASAEESLARARIYRLLAGVFAEEPSPALLSALRQDDLLAQLAEAGVGFDADFLQPGLTALHETLSCEYATLFAASGGFPPVESVRLMGRYMQEPAYATAQTYRRIGFSVTKGRFEFFADHLGVELTFVAELLQRHAAAIAKGDHARQRELDKEIRRFWTLHLGRWVRGYGRLIERAAQHSLYREMARFLVGFAEEEIAAMGLKRLEDLDQGREVVPKAEVPLEFNPDEPVCGGCNGPDAESNKATMPRVAPVKLHRLEDLRL